MHAPQSCQVGFRALTVHGAGMINILALLLNNFTQELLESADVPCTVVW